MIVPIRCFTCAKVIADKYDYYIEELTKLEKSGKKSLWCLRKTERSESLSVRHTRS